MGCGCGKDQTIVMADDANLESERNGAPVVY